MVQDIQANPNPTSYEYLACPYLQGDWPFDVDGRDIKNGNDTSFSVATVQPATVVNGLKVDTANNSVNSGSVPIDDISIATLDIYASTVAPEWSIAGWISTTPKDNSYTDIEYPTLSCNGTNCDTGVITTRNSGCEDTVNFTQLYGTYIVPIVGNSQYFAFFYKEQDSNNLAVCVYVPYFLECIFNGGGDVGSARYVYKCSPTVFNFVFPEIAASDFFGGAFNVFIEIHYTSTTTTDTANQMYVYLRPSYAAAGQGHYAKQAVSVPYDLTHYRPDLFGTPKADSDAVCHNIYPPAPGFRWLFPTADPQKPVGISNTCFVTLDNWAYYNKCVAAIVPPNGGNLIGTGYLDLLGSSQDPAVACLGPLARKKMFNYRRKILGTG